MYVYIINPIDYINPYRFVCVCVCVCVRESARMYIKRLALVYVKKVESSLV